MLRFAIFAIAVGACTSPRTSRSVAPLTTDVKHARYMTIRDDAAVMGVHNAALLAGIDAGLATRVEDRPQSIADWRRMLRSAESTSGKDPTRLSRKPGRLARAAARTRQARLTIRGPALWGAAGLAIRLADLAGA